MTATVTIDGREIVVTPAGRNALLWLRTMGGAATADRWGAHSQTRRRLFVTGLVDLRRARYGEPVTYRLTPAGRDACAQLTRPDL